MRKGNKTFKTKGEFLMEQIKKVYIVHYINDGDIEVCATFDIARERAEDFLRDISVDYSLQNYSEILNEFFESLSVEDEFFFVSDIVWVESKEILYR